MEKASIQSKIATINKLMADIKYHGINSTLILVDKNGEFCVQLLESYWKVIGAYFVENSKDIIEQIQNDLSFFFGLIEWL